MSHEKYTVILFQENGEVNVPSFTLTIDPKLTSLKLYIFRNFSEGATMTLIKWDYNRLSRISYFPHVP